MPEKAGPCRVLCGLDDFASSYTRRRSKVPLQPAIPAAIFCHRLFSTVKQFGLLVTLQVSQRSGVPRNCQRMISGLAVRHCNAECMKLVSAYCRSEFSKIASKDRTLLFCVLPAVPTLRTGAQPWKLSHDPQCTTRPVELSVHPSGFPSSEQDSLHDMDAVRYLCSIVAGWHLPRSTTPAVMTQCGIAQGAGAVSHYFLEVSEGRRGACTGAFPAD